MIKKVITVSSMGNILEYYDLGLFGFLSPVLAAYFFSQDDPFVAIIATITAFSSGFIARPLGGLIFGYIGDKYGRKKALNYSIIMMSIPTMLIAFLPGYESWGIMSAVCLFFLRFFQGISTGGEYNGSGIFCMEHVNKDNRGFWGGVISASAILGFFLSSLIAYACTFNIFPQKSWKWAFVFGGCIGLLGIYIRQNIPESPIFKKFIKSNKKLITFSFSNLFNNKLRCFLVFIIGGCTGGLSLNLIGITMYLTNIIGIPYSEAILSNNIAIIFYFLFTLLYAWLADKYGAVKIVVLNSIIIIIFAFPAYLLISICNFWAVIAGQIFLASFAGGYLGPSNILSYQAFATKNRYLGISFNFSLGLSIFGGGGPLITTYLSYFFSYQPFVSIYIILIAILKLCVILNFKEYFNIPNKK